MLGDKPLAAIKTLYLEQNLTTKGQHALTQIAKEQPKLLFFILLTTETASV